MLCLMYNFETDNEGGEELSRQNYYDPPLPNNPQPMDELPYHCSSTSASSSSLVPSASSSSLFPSTSSSSLLPSASSSSLLPCASSFPLTRRKRSTTEDIEY
ncbi:hypothetical protein TKK_0014438 [Trichogramma kaykai]